MSNFTSAIEQISSQNLFITHEPEVVDFTSGRTTALRVISKDTEIKIPLSTDITKLKEMLGLLQCYLGNDKTISVVWKLKNFLTFAKAQTGINFEMNGTILDLSILENYLGIELPCPETFTEAFVRLKKLMSLPNWQDIYGIYNKVYKPLIEILPNIETLGFINKKKKKQVYSFYEIDGQINGRMKCSNVFAASFNPHNMSSEEKENLYPYGFDELFVSFDFKHMEVTMLQWLSKDDFLGDLITSGRDTYESLWEAITSSPCNQGNRQKCKEFFLPVVYGLGANTLAENLKIPTEYAKRLIDRIHKTVPLSMGWIKKQQDSLLNNKTQDFFGRVRTFDSPYKVRNFSVQSPASLVCVHKLVSLAEALKGIANIGMHIHDGYILICNRKNLRKVVNISQQILEKDDDLYRGLKLKALCKTGNNLNNLAIY